MRYRVSIPNGMKFYSLIVWASSSVSRVSIPNGMKFYCQGVVAVAIPWKLFQFPTGWNSTTKTWIRSWKKSWFQFPTGWNSTKCERSEHSVRAEFQFPTGWNSTVKFFFDFIQIFEVSIPNGMKFYITALKSFLEQYLFQFPTGWNSTNPVPYKRTTQRAFQFPTGWNSTG